MIRCGWQLVAVAVFSVTLCTASANAQYVTVILERVQTARSLAGEVVDPEGGAIANATVELCSPEWKDCHTAATARPDGRFAIIPKQQRKLYYLRFSARGFDPLEIKAKVSRSSRKSLKVKLVVAT
jgi:hypothetical protein